MKLTYLLVIFLICLSVFSEISGMPASAEESNNKLNKKKKLNKKCYRFALTEFVKKVLRTSCRGRLGKKKKYTGFDKQ
ncbi:UNVERIFIED_CONTAM: hypothetical protein RMT77_017237 [Armadillidium vulgare]